MNADMKKIKLWRAFACIFAFLMLMLLDTLAAIDSCMSEFRLLNQQARAAHYLSTIKPFQPSNSSEGQYIVFNGLDSITIARNE
jgi:hypothetical protein